METLYFRDGKRKIDMILAYEDNGEQSSTAVTRRKRRETFQTYLEEEGFQMELEDKFVSGFCENLINLFNRVFIA